MRSVMFGIEVWAPEELLQFTLAFDPRLRERLFIVVIAFSMASRSRFGLESKFDDVSTG
jgi:hypothetical protein